MQSFVSPCLRYWIASVLVMLFSFAWPADVRAEIRVGTAKVDISPTQLPVLVNGSMSSRSADVITTRIYARALVLDDGQQQIGLCVVDSCMLPRQLCDEAKALVGSKTRLAPDRIMISATHTHSAPSSMGALGTNADPSYTPFLRQQIAEAFVQAEATMTACSVGWGSVDAPNFTALRRWVRRPDRIALDPFGNKTVRANMHAASNPDDAIGPTGPEDPELSLIAFRDLENQLVAVLCNFSMHYFGGQNAISADYFGLFCEQLEEQAADSHVDPLVIMSHGCSGDIWKRDYFERRPESEGTIEEYSLGLVQHAQNALASAQFDRDVTLAMEQTIVPMRYRVPDQQRLEWAERIVDQIGDRLPRKQPEIYAREQVLLNSMQDTSIVLQAIRIGDIAIATTPNETYALTGLKLKLQSPAKHTMVIELANGGDGYIPPPEQHRLGGYNTWAARSAGLEETAEPRIVAHDLQMLEQIFKGARHPFRQTDGPAAQGIQLLQPLAYWRLHEFEPPVAHDRSGNGNHAFIEPGVLFFLDGVDSERYCIREPNRCIHTAGGRLTWEDDPQENQLGNQFTIGLSFWNGMPADSRETLGWMLSCDRSHALSPNGIHLGLHSDGRLKLTVGSESMLGSSIVPRWTWDTVLLVCDGRSLQVYLNDAEQPEITMPYTDQPRSPQWFFGGRSDGIDGWEGRIDEVFIIDRALNTRARARLLRDGS